MMSFTIQRRSKNRKVFYLHTFYTIHTSIPKPLNNVLEKGQTHIGSEKQKNQKACTYYANTQVPYKKKISIGYIFKATHFKSCCLVKEAHNAFNFWFYL